MYTTLSRVKQEIKKEGEREKARAIDDALILRAIEDVRGRIDRLKSRTFAPYKGIEYYDALYIENGGTLDDHTLWLNHDVLTLGAVRVEGVEVVLSTLVQYPLAPIASKTRLILKEGYWQELTMPYQQIEVEGIFCYRTSSECGWVSSGDALVSGVTATTTSLIVSDSGGVDARWNTRFSPGQLIRVEDEYMQIRSISVAGTPEVHTLNVIRGARGTTAATHDAESTIDTWYPEPDIITAATRWAAYLYAHAGEFAKTEVEGMNATVWPNDMPSDVQAALYNIPELERHVGG